MPGFINKNKEGYLYLNFSFMGFFRRMAVIGDRLSPFVSILCVTMAISNLIFR